MIATLLILGSAALHASWSALLKRHDDKVALSTVMQASGTIYAIPIAFFLPLPSADVWIIMAVSTAVHIIYQQFLIRSLAAGDLSVNYPIGRGTGPLLVTIASLTFIDDELAPLSVFAIGVIITGIMWTALVNIKRGASVKGIGWALMSGVSIAAYTIIDALGVRIAENAFSFIIWLQILYGPFFFLSNQIQTKDNLIERMQPVLKPGFALGVMWFGGYAMALMALKLGNLAEISALRETSIFFATMLGIFWLKEGFSKTKLVAAIMIASGAIIMKAF